MSWYSMRVCVCVWGGVWQLLGEQLVQAAALKLFLWTLPFEICCQLLLHTHPHGRAGVDQVDQKMLPMLNVCLFFYSFLFECQWICWSFSVDMNRSVLPCYKRKVVCVSVCVCVHALLFNETLRYWMNSVQYWTHTQTQENSGNILLGLFHTNVHECSFAIKLDIFCPENPLILPFCPLAAFLSLPPASWDPEKGNCFWLSCSAMIRFSVVSFGRHLRRRLSSAALPNVAAALYAVSYQMSESLCRNHRRLWSPMKSHTRSLCFAPPVSVKKSQKSHLSKARPLPLLRWQSPRIPSRRAHT